MKTSHKKFFSFALLRYCAISLAVVSLLSFAAVSQAAIINVSTTGGDYLIDSNSEGSMTALEHGGFKWTGLRTEALWDFRWEIEFNPDPFAAFLTEFQNNTGSTQTLVATFTDAMIVDFPAAGAPMTGSSALSINDANNDGSATMAAVSGKSIYTGLIDGNDAAMLFVAPYSLATTFVAVDLDSLAGVSPEDMDTSIGIRHEFTVTAGDKATANSRFEVVPEPSAALLACLGGLGMLLARRRQG